MAEASPFRAERCCVRVALKVTPKASREGVAGVALGPDGLARLVVRVRAAPEGGRANDAVRRLLARRWRLPASALSVVAGAGSRSKQLLVEGEGDELLARLRAIEEHETKGSGA